MSILAQFQSNQSQTVMVDDCRSKLVDVVSGVWQGCVFEPFIVNSACTLLSFFSFWNIS